MACSLARSDYTRRYELKIMRTTNCIFLITLILWIFPSVIFCDQDNEFPYKVIIAATGSEKQIQVEGHWLNINFSYLSNKEGVKALLGLRWQVLDRNSEGKIFLYGKKLDSFHIDIDGKTKVYDFVLTEWHIKCPFEFYIEPEGWIPGDDLEVGIKQTLDSTHFSYPIDEDKNKYCNNKRNKRGR